MAEATPSRLQVDLSGQVALVTGASRGLGFAIALALGRCGAKVACVARNVEKLAETVQAIKSAGGEAESWACDVTDSANVNQVVDAVVEKWSRIDILVNNAGITQDTLLLKMDDAQWDAVIGTNLKGMFLFTKAASRVMLSQRYGRVINLSSVAGLMGNAGQANYSASKAGMIGFSRTVARELGSRNITVNAVAPGMIQTEMTAVLPKEMLDEIVKRRIPARRLGQPEDVAEAVLFLASKSASYINGQVLTVDGGLTAAL